MPKQRQRPDYDLLSSADANLLVADIPTEIKRWLKRLLNRPLYPSDKIRITLYFDRHGHRRKLTQFLKRKGLSDQGPRLIATERSYARQNFETS